MNLPVGLLNGLSQRFQEILTVHIVKINLIPAIPSAHYMINGTRIFDSQLARHDPVFSQPDHYVKTKMHLSMV
jgi:hypothetical protein